jgi:hypothetical protein
VKRKHGKEARGVKKITTVEEEEDRDEKREEDKEEGEARSKRNQIDNCNHL